MHFNNHTAKVKEIYTYLLHCGRLDDRIDEETSTDCHEETNSDVSESKLSFLSGLFDMTDCGLR